MGKLLGWWHPNDQTPAPVDTELAGLAVRMMRRTLEDILEQCVEDGRDGSIATIEL